MNEARPVVTVAFDERDSTYEVTFVTGNTKRYGLLSTAVSIAWYACPSDGQVVFDNMTDEDFESAAAQARGLRDKETAAAARRNRQAVPDNWSTQRRNPATGHFVGGGRGER